MSVSLERASELVLAATRPLPAERVAVAEAGGRILAGELRARADSPPAASSAMDGFAVTAGPSGRRLRLTGESRAGQPSRVDVDRETAVRIATGGVLPAGAEAVVALEQATAAGDWVTVDAAVAAGRNVRGRGEDVRTGQLILDTGTRLRAFELAVAVGAGHGELVCHRRPGVALIGTGDELRDPGTSLGPGQVHDSNTVALASLAADAGAVIVGRERVGDDRAAIRRALDQAFDGADLVVVSGGVSVGRHDHVRGALADLGAEEHFWGVEIRPGRPTWFGRRGGPLILGLPGNPVAAIVAFMLLGRPVLAALQGIVAPTRGRARLTRPVTRHPGRTEVVRVQLRPATAMPDDGTAGLRAVPAGGPPASHVTRALLGIEAVALVPSGRGELPAGSEVDIERLWA